MIKQDIVINLRTRAAIRRKIPRAKDGEVDRIAEMCDEAADEIERLRSLVELLQEL